MTTTQIAAQIFGLIGLGLNVCSFQAKSDRRLVLMQGLGGLAFFVNFILIGAISAALFNISCLVRAILFFRNKNRLWKFVAMELLYTACFVFSLTMIGTKALQITLSFLTFLALLGATAFMWIGNGRSIRYFQLFYASPAWIVHNIFNFTLGGIICEALNIISVIVSFVRFGSKFEK